ncbi:MAG: hypothetical protein ACO1RX_22705 [Candidatus Sericytochromatia bacterium]
MKRTSLLGLACTLLLAACQIPFAGVSQPPDTLPGQWGGIVPSPKGPRPLENIALPPLSNWLSTGIAKQGRDVSLGIPQRMGHPEGAQPVAAPMVGAAPDSNAGGNATGAAQTSGPLLPPPDHSADPMAAAPLPLASDMPLQAYGDLTSSLGPELVAYALDNGYLPSSAWAARRWEFWNATQQPPGSWVTLGAYQLGLGLWQYTSAAEKPRIELGLQLRAPQLSLAERPALNLSVVVDTSSALKNPLVQVSPNAPGSLLTAVQTTLQALPGALKPGDQLSIIGLDGEVLLDRWPVSADFTPLRALSNQWAQNRIPQLTQSLEHAYQRVNGPAGVAKAVILLSTGEAVQNLAAEQEQLLRGQAQGVSFAALELGQLTTDPQRLAQATASVGGVYLPVQTLSDAQRSLGRDLIALLNLQPTPVELELILPPELEALRSPLAAAAAVPVNSLALNRSLSVLQAYQVTGELPLTGTVRVRLHSQDPQSGARQTTEYAQTLESLLRQSQTGQNAPNLQLLTGAVSGELTPEQVKRAWEQKPPALTEADRAAQRRLGIWLTLNKRIEQEK